MFYLTLIPQSGTYDATGWLSTNGPLQLISDFQGGGALQYSDPIGLTIDEHVVIRDDQSTHGPVTFDLQMIGGVFGGCIVWGTAIPST